MLSTLLARQASQLSASSSTRCAMSSASSNKLAAHSVVVGGNGAFRTKLALPYAQRKQTLSVKMAAKDDDEDRGTLMINFSITVGVSSDTHACSFHKTPMTNTTLQQTNKTKQCCRNLPLTTTSTPRTRTNPPSRRRLALPRPSRTPI